MSMERKASYSRADVRHSPLVVFYELTQACDLACLHCRAQAEPRRHPEELTRAQAKLLLEQLSTFPKPPLLVLTGGDPLKRPDVTELVRYGVQRGLEVAMTPSATPLVTARSLGELRESGLSRLAVSLDGANAATHDRFRGMSGSFERTIEILRDGAAAGLDLQINTTVTCLNAGQLDQIADLIAAKGIVLWSVFFLVPVGRGGRLGRISAEQYEAVFRRLLYHSRHQPYAIKTTEAPHYRRFVLQNQQDADTGRGELPGRRGPPTRLGINDGKGVLFISHTGRIFPSGFLPIECGRFPAQGVVEVYQNADLFRRLRDPNQLHGKCGRCEFRHVCGGSRARAYAATGDVLAEEPDCLHIPAATGQSAVAG